MSSYTRILGVSDVPARERVQPRTPATGRRLPAERMLAALLVAVALIAVAGVLRVDVRPSIATRGGDAGVAGAISRVSLPDVMSLLPPPAAPLEADSVGSSASVRADGGIATETETEMMDMIPGMGVSREEYGHEHEDKDGEPSYPPIEIYSSIMLPTKQCRKGLYCRAFLALFQSESAGVGKPLVYLKAGYTIFAAADSKGHYTAVPVPQINLVYQTPRETIQRFSSALVAQASLSFAGTCAAHPDVNAVTNALQSAMKQLTDCLNTKLRLCTRDAFVVSC